MDKKVRRQVTADVTLFACLPIKDDEVYEEVARVAR